MKHMERKNFNSLQQKSCPDVNWTSSEYYSMVCFEDGNASSDSVGDTINVNLDASLNNIYDKEMWEKKREVNSIKAYITNDHTSIELF